MARVDRERRAEVRFGDGRVARLRVQLSQVVARVDVRGFELERSAIVRLGGGAARGTSVLLAQQAEHEVRRRVRRVLLGHALQERFAFGAAAAALVVDHVDGRLHRLVQGDLRACRERDEPPKAADQHLALLLEQVHPRI